MRTFVQVLILELDDDESNPAKWDWTEIIDVPDTCVLVAEGISTVEIETDWTEKQVDRFARLTINYRDAVRRVIGVLGWSPN